MFAMNPSLTGGARERLRSRFARYCGAAGAAQRLLMQLSPVVQQSDACVHASYTIEQPFGGVTHFATSPVAARQKPVQHWSPDWQLVPVAWHAGRTQ
jgi:hypothetical protein